MVQEIHQNTTYPLKACETHLKTINPATKKAATIYNISFCSVEINKSRCHPRLSFQARPFSCEGEISISVKEQAEQFMCQFESYF